MKSAESPKPSVFEGQVIAITGAGSGIGQALAVKLSSLGAIVSLCDKDAEALDKTCSMLNEKKHFKQTVDVLDDEAIKEWIEASFKEFGQFNGIINNAGTSVIGPFEDITPEQFDKVMATNLRAVVCGTRYAMPYLKESKPRAWLVNINSVSGLVGSPGESVYSTSKFAIRGFMEAITYELAMSDPHISVLRVHPGLIQTNMANAIEFTESSKVDRDIAVKLMAKGMSKEKAAEMIVRAMEKGKQRQLITRHAHVQDLLSRIKPVPIMKLYLWRMKRFEKKIDRIKNPRASWWRRVLQGIGEKVDEVAFSVEIEV